MLRILYLAPEHYTGALGLFVKAHRELGNHSRLVTLYRSRSDYSEDICLDLPLVGSQPRLMNLRRLVYRTHGDKGAHTPLKGNPPVWKSANMVEKLFFQARDTLWAPRISRALEKYHLLDFDIYHLEGGLGFFRDGRVIRRLKEMNKKIVCSYHGTDIRQRGVIPQIDAISDLNLTCELDLISMHPRLEYLFLPIDTSRFTPREHQGKARTIGHAPTSRYFKGSDAIIRVCRDLENEFGVQLILIENKPHQEALRLKASCDIFIDQISNLGGWGYGMNSLESLSLGIPTCTNMLPQYEEFLPDHPFINVDSENLRERLIALIQDPELREQKARQGREWVERRHDIHRVMEDLYGYYRRLGWSGEDGGRGTESAIGET
ncbi:glycosyltransferase [Candidatus Zixiibacteriota bacterium]